MYRDPPPVPGDRSNGVGQIRRIRHRRSRQDGLHYSLGALEVMRLSWIHIIATSTILVATGTGLRALAEDGKVVRALAGREGFDTSVRPQDDFFRYVNGGWIASTEI